MRQRPPRQQVPDTAYAVQNGEPHDKQKPGCKTEPRRNRNVRRILIRRTFFLCISGSDGQPGQPAYLRMNWRLASATTSRKASSRNSAESRT